MPMWVSLAVSTGLGLWGAKKQSDAAGKAADQQVQATDKGLALQEQIYGQQVAGMQPYADRGQQALGSLGDLMGFPALPPQRPAGAAGSVAIPLNPNAPGNWGTSTPPLNMSDPRVQHLAKGGSLGDPEVRGAGTLGAAMGAGGSSAYGGGVSGPPAGMGGSMPAPGPVMISVLSPNGNVGQIPEAALPAALAAGGKRVG